MKKILFLLLFAMAFGVIEGSVVVYLRPLFNAGKADFSLQVINDLVLTEPQKVILVTEIGREIATLVLLIAVSAVAATSFFYWISYFVFCFAVWDIVYYVWLFLMIGWPSSLLDWDVLFLIPKMWFAPVIVPLSISVFGILYSLFVVYALEKYKKIQVHIIHTLTVIAALVFWQISFLDKSLPDMLDFPDSYSWWMFFAGLGLGLISLFSFTRSNLSKKSNNFKSL